MSETIHDTLTERGKRYGEFRDQATITQAIKNAMLLGQQWENLQDDQKECLDMIANKVGRILNGDPNYIDSWWDIIGYTQLVVDRLREDEGSQERRERDLANCVSASTKQNPIALPTAKPLPHAFPQSH